MAEKLMTADKRLIYEVLSVVDEISLGKVATYGQIARLIDKEKNARLVGKILRISQQCGEYMDSVPAGASLIQMAKPPA